MTDRRRCRRWIVLAAVVVIALAEPWGDILAHDDSGVRAITTAKYDGKPIDVDARVIEAIYGRNGDGQA